MKYIYQGTLYTLYVEDKLKEALSRLGDNAENDQDALSNDSQKAQETIEIIDKKISPANAKVDNIFNLSTSSGEKSPDNGSPNSRRKSSYKKGDEEIVINIKTNDENGNNFHNLAAGVKLKDQDRRNLEEINKFIDEKVNFKSFDIIKVLGSGAFGKVYKVNSLLVII